MNEGSSRRRRGERLRRLAIFGGIGRRAYQPDGYVVVFAGARGALRRDRRTFGSRTVPDAPGVVAVMETALAALERHPKAWGETMKIWEQSGRAL